MTASDFTLFEVTTKPGRNLEFRRGELVVASSTFKAKDGARIYFCATAQPSAFRMYLSLSADVQSYEEL